MKLSLSVLALAFLALETDPAKTEETLAYAPEDGTVLRRTFVSVAEYSLQELAMFADGEEIHTNTDRELEVEATERIVVTDELREVADGRPLVLARTFDEIHAENTYSAEEAEEDFTQVSQSDFEGTTIVFSWEEDDEEYTVETDDDDGIDEDWLEGLREDMDLRGVLPTGEVEEGDSWEIDADAYLPLMWPSGLLALYDEEGEFDADEYQLNLNTLEGVEAEGKATLKELREEDGRRVAVIGVVLEANTDADHTIDTGEREVTRGRKVSREVEGEVLWDLEGNHLFSAELEAESELVFSQQAEVPGHEGDLVDLRETQTFEGTLEYTVEIERKQ